MHISLSSHISRLNEWQSLSKRTQFLRYNHEHHECKETSFVFESRIESKHRCIEYHQWRAEQRRCVTTNSTDTHKSLFKRHALNRSYKFIIDNTVSIYCFDDVKLLCSRRAIFFLREFCSFNTYNIVSFMSQV